MKKYRYLFLITVFALLFICGCFSAEGEPVYYSANIRNSTDATIVVRYDYDSDCSWVLAIDPCDYYYHEEVAIKPGDIENINWHIFNVDEYSTSTIEISYKDKKLEIDVSPHDYIFGSDFIDIRITDF